MLRVTLLQFALQVSAAMLVLAQAVQLTLIVLQGEVTEACELTRLILLATCSHATSSRVVRKAETRAGIGGIAIVTSGEARHVVCMMSLGGIRLDCIIVGGNLERQSHW